MGRVGGIRGVGWAALVAVFLASCAGNKPEDRPPLGDDDEETTPPECVGDEQCVHGREICEADVCVPGDRDNAVEEATAVGLGDQVATEGWIFPEGDVDHYVYRPPGPQWVSIATVSSEASELNTVVSVWNAAGELHASGDDFPIYPFDVFGTLRGEDVDFDTVLFVYLPDEGPWYVQVQDRATWTDDTTATGPRGGRNWHYDLVLNESPGTAEPDAAETPSWVVDLDSENIIHLVGVVIDEPGDVDHVQVDFPFENHLLEVWGQPDTPGSTASPLVRLLEGPDVVAEKVGLGGDAGWLSWFHAHAGSFALEATNVDGSGGRASWFMVYLRTYRAIDSHPFFGTDVYQTEQLYNDTPAEAQALPPDFESGFTAFHLDGAIESPGDVDWWLIDADETDQISVQCWTDRFGSLAVLELSLATGGGTEFFAAYTPDDDDYFVRDHPIPGPGPLELRVRTAGGSGPGYWYRCSVHVAP